mgnify:CR=1 FL=1
MSLQCQRGERADKSDFERLTGEVLELRQKVAELEARGAASQPLDH